MLKVILTVCAIISSIIALMVFTTSLPATQKQVEENTEAIADNSTYIETVDNALENVQESLDDISLYRHDLFIRKITETANIYLTIYSNKSDKIDTFDKFFNIVTSSYTSGSYGQYISVSGEVSTYRAQYISISLGGYPGATFSVYVVYRTDIGTSQLTIDNTFTFLDTVNIVF